MKKIVIDPLTRIEGHLKVEVVVDGGEVKEARCTGTLFRGWEIILKGRHPLDAQRITQRVCGVCPTAHATASTFALDDAFGIADKIPDNGRLLRNLILGCNYIQSHVLHFYHLAALDFVDVTAAADYNGEDDDLQAVKAFIGRGALGPFVPRHEGDYRFSPEVNRTLTAHYVQALRTRRLAHEMLCIFGGKMPHSATIMPGGNSEAPTADKIATFLGKLNEVRNFIDTRYVPDVLAAAKTYPDYAGIGAGCRRYLAYGSFDLQGQNVDPATRERLLPQGLVTADGELQKIDAAQITESVAGSWFSSPSGLHPSEGETEPDPHKDGGYSWIKSPRYDGKSTEVGPLARAMVAYSLGAEPLKGIVDSVLNELGAGPEALSSVLGRHAARAIETKIVADAMVDWLLALKPGEPVCADWAVPDEAQGVGLTCAPRGALGHWITIKDGVIDRYQLVVPTTWNACPRDEEGQPGPIEQALEGTKVNDPENPFEVLRIVRSFDPCLACAVHVINARGSDVRRFRVA